MPQPPTLSTLNWSHPLMSGWYDIAKPVVGLASWPTPSSLDAVLRPWLSVAGVRLRGATATGSSAKALYEIEIADEGSIPTRCNNLHDLLNAMAWAAFPFAKRSLTHRLAELQRQRITAGARLPGTRSPLHDHLALLDEGGVIIASKDGEVGRDGNPDRIGSAIGSGAAHAWVFGHAVLEHAVDRRPIPRVALVPIACATRSRSDVDAALANTIERATAGELLARGPGAVADLEWFAA